MRGVGLAQHAIAFATRSAIPDRVSAASQIAAKYRPDIDGLRAVAIAAVFIFHATPHLLRGGFVGVDVFFVISGFLIIRIILEGLETSKFSLAGFYARRVRRIFPALICVLGAIWALGWHFMLPEDFQELGKQIVAGAAFSSNLLTYSQVGYFDAPAITKPLLHLWSLGVEEQFYLVTPLALIALARRRISMPLALGATAVASFAFNIALVRYDQEAASISRSPAFGNCLSAEVSPTPRLHLPIAAAEARALGGLFGWVCYSSAASALSDAIHECSPAGGRFLRCSGRPLSSRLDRGTARKSSVGFSTRSGNRTHQLHCILALAVARVNARRVSQSCMVSSSSFWRFR